MAKEFERFAPNLRVQLHYGSNRDKGNSFEDFLQSADVVLTSYALAQLDEEELTSLCWDAVILDEAQNIKNPHTKQSKAVRNLQANHKIALTGTPMENRLAELWSIFDFINHGYLGSLGQFQRRFVTPIEKIVMKEKFSKFNGLSHHFTAPNEERSNSRIKFTR